MTNPKLALIPSGYKATKVYSILPSDGGGDFTFDRASEGTRVRKDGLIEEVTDDVPRLDWSDGNCPSLLLEPQRSNLITYSEDFSQSSWVGGNVTRELNQIISPDGTLNATKLSATAPFSQIQQSYTSVNNTDYTLSVFVKSPSSNVVGLRLASGSNDVRREFNLSTLSIQSMGGNNQELIDEGIVDFGSGWYRIFLTCKSDGTSSFLNIYPKNSSDATFQSTYVYGAQLEQASYPTSYIKTEGSTVTRLKDECINGGDSDLFNITEGTFFVDANNFGTPYLGYNMITLSDGSSNLVRFIYESSRIRTSVENGSIQQNYFITGVNDNERNKVAITFKENEFKTYLNGVLKDTDLIGVVPTGLDRLNFASQSGTTRHFEGKVYDTRVYDRVLTEAEAIELTTL